jgi:uncharacterized surface anchored protein
MATVTLRNSLTGETHPVEVQTNRTVRQSVSNSGVIAGNEFSVRDKNGNVVDNDQLASHEGEVLNIGLPGDMVRGG